MVPLEQTLEKADDAWANGRMVEAFNILRLAATSGDKHCMLNLGYFYDHGIGISRCKSAALHWYKAAFRSGDLAAASNLASCYTKQGDHRRAMLWYKRAASLGDGDAEVEIAKILRTPNASPRAQVLAVRSLRHALNSRFISDAAREEAKLLLRRGRHAA
jgi:uncharacterized protein